MSEDFFTVSELNNFIKDVIGAGFPRSLWVCGEIQGFRRAKSGHIYFDLVEKEEDSSKITAKISAAVFANRVYAVENKLKKAENAFELKNDIEVKFSGNVSFYAPYGTISFIVEDIDPTYTLGRLAQEKQKLIAELAKKGVLEQNKSIAFPPVPLNIGLITSHESAAFKDFSSELQKSGFGFKVYLRSCLMQGKAAEKDVVKAIDTLEGQKDMDIIVITRGGGSTADLSDFDSRIIAERIAACKRPVLTGIGHEIDLSVTDLAAYAYAKTPTAVAQLLVAHVTEFVGRIDEKWSVIQELTEKKFQAARARVKEQAHVLQHKTTHYLRDHRENIIRIQEVLRHKPEALMQHGKKELDNQWVRVKKSVSAGLQNAHNRLMHGRKLISSYDPVNVIKKGFSITRDKNGLVIKNIRSVQEGDTIKTEIVNGIFKSKILEA